MKTLRHGLLAWLSAILASHCLAADVNSDPNPRQLIEQAMTHWRGLSSYSELTMTVHRPDWQRNLSMRAWTHGDKTSLVRITAPQKDAGAGTLLDNNRMWTYAPNINRVVKVPSSMMNQSWMGSDFSNKDISKSTDIIDQYQHRLLTKEQRGAHLVYEIESIPLESAAVVWGREVLFIRDDYVLLEQQFWDQDNRLVKTLKALSIAPMGGRQVATRMRMQNIEKPGEWTQMDVSHITFDIDIPPHVFTLSNLRNPRQ